MNGSRLGFSLIACCIIFILLACNQSVTDREMVKPYFDLKAYFLAEAERLSDETGFTKSVNLDGETEERKLDTLDWPTEFKAFTDSDINLPAWYDLYDIDSSFAENGSLKALRYTAQDTSLRTRSIELEFESNQPSYIFILRQSDSPLAQTFKEMKYSPVSGYFILNRQQLKFAEEKEVKVEVSWRK